jgi:hypothetical protein
MSNIDRVISRLERAGGAVTEAIQIAETISTHPPFTNRMVSLNIALGDLRRAGVRLSNGEDPDAVMETLNEHLREAFE